jgi:glycosyltransferase involved in cell wall biosynthesis
VISLSSGGSLAASISGGGIEVFEMGWAKNTSNFGPFLKLTRLLRRLKPDILQSWLYHADLLGLFAGMLNAVPSIAWNIRCAELDPRDLSWQMVAIRRTLALTSRLPTAVVCNSTAGELAHRSIGYRPRRWVVIPNGFDVSQFQPDAMAGTELRRELALRPDATLVGLLARYHPMKDHRTFLSAASQILSTGRDVHFVAAGRGVPESSDVREQIDHLGLGPRVHLLQERQDAARFLAALDVSVMCSSSEGFPNVVAEAMASGIPCVATDVGDAASIVGGAGVVVAPRDSAALAAGITRLLDLDVHARADLSLAARERIGTHFSLDAMAQRYEQLYLEMTGRREITMGAPACAG